MSAPLDGPVPVSSGFYPTRISTKLGWIYSVTDPAGDLESDGAPNLLEYPLHNNPIASDAAQLPQVAIESSNLTLTYTKVTSATDIQYIVERSTDLVNWTTASPTNEIVGTNSNLQTIKAKVAINGTPRLFLRLRVTRP